ncbi:hypothetical protein SLS53_006655 [Cytospora paraplurivora]|uniref:Rhodopsin domain-containing protein n=1 Tax=Cytospora paraplurivora TaxID=2898453 RepID=A0AAN9YD80_9PEZI
MSGMSSEQLAYQEANINDNRGPEIIAVTLIGLNISACLMVRYGAGRHILWLAQHPENIVNMGKAEVPFSYFYDATMAFGKLSALTFIVRTFTTHDPIIRYGSYFLGLYVILWWIAGLLVISLQCQPFSSYWGDPYTCEVSNATSISVAVFDIISDIAVLLLPQRSIWRLQLSFKKKLGLSLMFFFGFWSWLTKAQSSRKGLLSSENSRNVPTDSQSAQVGTWHKLHNMQGVETGSSRFGTAESTERFDFKPLGVFPTQQV